VRLTHVLLNATCLNHNLIMHLCNNQTKSPILSFDIVKKHPKATGNTLAYINRTPPGGIVMGRVIVPGTAVVSRRRRR